MRIAVHRHADALCGEYLLGAMGARPRRRFERALREEPALATRLAAWRRVLEPAPATAALPPMRHRALRAGWQRLHRELGLARWSRPWHRRLGVWRGLSAGAVTVAVIATTVALRIGPPSHAPDGQRWPASARELAVLVPTAVATDAIERPSVRALASDEGATLHLLASRAVLAGPSQSFELWLLPAGGAAPVSLAVLGALDARAPIAARRRADLSPGARLAISVEPAGGSPTGTPTGPVIFVGEIRAG